MYSRMVLAADSEVEKEEWLNAINNAISRKGQLITIPGPSDAHMVTTSSAPSPVSSNNNIFML